MPGTCSCQIRCEFELGFSLAVDLYNEVGVLREQCAQPRSPLATVLSGLFKIAIHRLLNPSQRRRVPAVLFGLLLVLRRRTPRREQ